MAGAPKIVEYDYEVKLGVFEGPLDLLLYLVQKNELDPRQISIAAITDQYLVYIDAALKGVDTEEEGPDGVIIRKAPREVNLSNAGEFLVMASRLMRLKARELLPADQKDELEDMEYELDRQALIQQMLEYQKFKEAARALRGIEGKNFGGFGRGKDDTGEEKETGEVEEEAGIFDLLSAFRAVVLSRPKAPVHEVEIDDVTIEDKIQEVEVQLQERGRSLFEDLFSHDQRTISLVVTFMAILELAKLDRIVFRQSHGLGPIWVYRKQKSSEFELELKIEETHLEPLPEFKEGLVEIVQAQIKKRAVQNALEEALRELEQGTLTDDELETTPPAPTADAEAAPIAQAAVAAETVNAPGTANSVEALAPSEVASPLTNSEPAHVVPETQPEIDPAVQDLVDRIRIAAEDPATEAPLAEDEE